MAIYQALKKYREAKFNKRHFQVLGIGVAFPRFYAPNFPGAKFKYSLEIAWAQNRTPFQYQIDGSVAVRHIE